MKKYQLGETVLYLHEDNWYTVIVSPSSRKGYTNFIVTPEPEIGLASVQIPTKDIDASVELRKLTKLAKAMK